MRKQRQQQQQQGQAAAPLRGGQQVLPIQRNNPDSMHNLSCHHSQQQLAAAAEQWRSICRAQLACSPTTACLMAWLVTLWVV
jgi:hypothetical protein